MFSCAKIGVRAGPKLPPSTDGPLHIGYAKLNVTNRILREVPFFKLSLISVFRVHLEMFNFY